MTIPKPSLDYSYTAFQQSQGDNSFPGTQLDNDLANLKTAVDAVIDVADTMDRAVVAAPGDEGYELPERSSLLSKFLAVSAAGMIIGAVGMSSVPVAAFGATLVDDTTAAEARTTLGLGSAALASITAFGQTLIDDADAVAARATLGLGTAAVANIGTSGAAVPLLNATNTWSGSQRYGISTAAAPLIADTLNASSGFHFTNINSIARPNLSMGGQPWLGWGAVTELPGFYSYLSAAGGTTLLIKPTDTGSGSTGVSAFAYSLLGSGLQTGLAEFHCYMARGTPLAPLALIAGDEHAAFAGSGRSGNVIGNGWGGANGAPPSELDAYCTENWTATATGSMWRIEACKRGTNGRLGVLSLYGEGNIGIGMPGFFGPTDTFNVAEGCLIVNNAPMAPNAAIASCFALWSAGGHPHVWIDGDVAARKVAVQVGGSAGQYAIWSADGQLTGSASLVSAESILTRFTESALPQSRVFAVASGLALTDGGALGNLTLGWNLPALIDKTSPDASGDYALIYDGSGASTKRAFLGKITKATTDAITFLTRSTEANLPLSRVLAAAAGFSLTDGGALGALTIGWNLTGLTTETTVDQAADWLVMYDASEGAVNKIAPGSILAASQRFAGTRSSAQTIAHDTWTKVQINNEVLDPHSVFDSATNHRFLPTVAGDYAFIASVGFDTSAANAQVQAALYKNGSLTAFIAKQNCPDTDGAGCTVAGIITLNGSTDYVELFAYHDSGSDQTLHAGRVTFTAFRVG